MLGREKEYKVTKEQLLAKLKANRSKHVHLYEEAKEGWKKQAIAALEKTLATAREGQQFSLNFTALTAPRSHQKEYDQAIGLLEMSVDTYVSITAHDYDRFVLDQWEWKATWVGSNMPYSTSLQESDEIGFVE